MAVIGVSAPITATYTNIYFGFYTQRMVRVDRTKKHKWVGGISPNSSALQSSSCNTPAFPGSTYGPKSGDNRQVYAMCILNSHSERVSASTVQRSIIDLLGACSLHRLKTAPQKHNFIPSKTTVTRYKNIENVML